MSSEPAIRATNPVGGAQASLRVSVLMNEIRNRVRGVLLGLAAGDRNGGPIRMAVRLAESLSERWRFDPDDILTRYLAWWRDGAFDTGPTTADSAQPDRRRDGRR